MNRYNERILDMKADIVKEYYKEDIPYEENRNRKILKDGLF
jgi:hypothetical protein